MNQTLAALALCLGGIFIGCGSLTEGPSLHPATGRVLFERQPATGVVVQLVPINQISQTSRDGTFPGGISDLEGNFRLTTIEPGDGAAIGEYKLVLFWPPPEKGPFSSTAEKEFASPTTYQGPPDRFQGKYFDAKQSRWTIQINQGTNQIPDIHLP
jgi:hypothetical protein